MGFKRIKKTAVSMGQIAYMDRVRGSIQAIWTQAFIMQVPIEAPHLGIPSLNIRVDIHMSTSMTINFS